MSQQPDLEARVAALEARVSELDGRLQRNQQDAAAARVLAGGADRDVAEIRSEIRGFREQNTRVLNAMREDLTDVRSDLTDVRSDLTDLRSDLTDLRSHVGDGFAEMRAKFDVAAAGQEQIVGLLNTLIGQEEDD